MRIGLYGPLALKVSNQFLNFSLAQIIYKLKIVVWHGHDRGSDLPNSGHRVLPPRLGDLNTGICEDNRRRSI